MKKIFLSFSILMLTLLLTGCLNLNKPQLKLVYLSDSIHRVGLTSNGILLPSTYFIPDTMYVLNKDILAEEDRIIDLLGTKDTIQLKGDTLQHKGDTVKLFAQQLLYDTEIVSKDDGIYVYSPRMLKVCQINLQYSDDVIFNKVFNTYLNRCNRTLDFLKKEDNLYVYYAPYSNWESGGYESLEEALIMYKPINEDSYHYLSSDNEITIKKIDFEKYFESFKAYLVLN